MTTGSLLLLGSSVSLLQSMVFEKLCFFLVNERIDVSDHLFYEGTDSIIDIVSFQLVALN